MTEHPSAVRRGGALERLEIPSVATLLRHTVGVLERLDDIPQAIGGRTNAYPPFDIERRGNEFTIVVAVAGYAPENLEIEIERHQLRIAGRSPEREDSVEVLHQGIARRDFRLNFTLGEHVHLHGSARVESGLLRVPLRREIPEADKPRRVPVEGAAGPGSA